MRVDNVFLSASGSHKLLNAADLSGAAAGRTLDLQLSDTWSKVILFVKYTYGAATAVTTTVTVSPDGTNYFALQSGAIISGTRTLSDFVDSKTTGAANQSYSMEYDVRGLRNIKFVFEGSGAPTAVDVVDVYAVVAVGY